MWFRIDFYKFKVDKIVLHRGFANQWLLLIVDLIEWAQSDI